MLLCCLFYDGHLVHSAVATNVDDDVVDDDDDDDDDADDAADDKRHTHDTTLPMLRCVATVYTWLVSDLG